MPLPAGRCSSNKPRQRLLRELLAQTVRRECTVLTSHCSELSASGWQALPRCCCVPVGALGAGRHQRARAGERCGPPGVSAHSRHAALAHRRQSGADTQQAAAVSAVLSYTHQLQPARPAPLPVCHRRLVLVLQARAAFASWHATGARCLPQAAAACLLSSGRAGAQSWPVPTGFRDSSPAAHRS